MAIVVDGIVVISQGSFSEDEEKLVKKKEDWEFGVEAEENKMEDCVREKRFCDGRE